AQPGPRRAGPAGRGRVARRRTAPAARPVAARAGRASDDELGERYLVHRWTAGSLARLADAETVTAHRRAAAYRLWRASLYERDPFDDLTDLEEARYHLWEAGQPDEAVAATVELCGKLHTRGAFGWEWQVCEETVA